MSQNQKRKSLGSGLSHLGLGELLSDMDNQSVLAQSAVDSGSMAGHRLHEVPVHKICAGRYQPRRTFSPESLEEMSQSIRSQGVIQPILLRPVNDVYEIIAGERRWRAAERAGLNTIPAIVREVPDEAAIALSLIENIQRQDLSVMEEAIALQRLIEEFDLTHQQAADAVGKSRALVSNLLRLLKLAPEVKTFLDQQDLEMGHARALLALETHQQVKAAAYVVEHALSVRQTENYVRRLRKLDVSSRKNSSLINPDLMALQNELSETLATPVHIRPGSKEKGRLIIYYHDLDALEGVLERIRS